MKKITIILLLPCIIATILLMIAVLWMLKITDIIRVNINLKYPSEFILNVKSTCNHKKVHKK